MKKILLFMLATGITFYACKKDNEKEDTPPVTLEIDTNNPAEMTAAIKVFHSTNVKGTMPAANSAGAPVLSATSNNRTITAAKGGNAVIKPAVTSGSITGYYLKVTGADSYFKVDYSKPRAARETGNNADSTIVIQIPGNTKPGTFCVEYAAYDSLGHTSNVIKVCITVVATLKDPQAQITGTWKLNDPAYYKPDTFYSKLKCQDDTLAACYGSNCLMQVHVIYKNENYSYTLAADSVFIYNTERKVTEVELNRTPCNTTPPYVTHTETATERGKWFYDETTQILTIVWPSNGPSTYLVTELTDGKLVLDYPGDPGNPREYTKQ